MKRVFVDSSSILGDIIHITDKRQISHLLHVLRMKNGDRILAFDGAGMEYVTEIFCVTKNGVELRIMSSQPYKTESKTAITLFQGIPKGQKMDDIVRKSTELGVHRIVPLETARVVGERNAESYTRKIERFRRIAEEAAKQSQRGDIPEVTTPATITKAATIISDGASNFDMALLLYELEDGLTLKQALRQCDDEWMLQKLRNIALFIGPEGGFEEYEAELLTRYGAISVTVGNTILRTETAGPAALAMLLYELEL